MRVLASCLPGMVDTNHYPRYNRLMETGNEHLYARLTAVLACESLEEQLWRDIQHLPLPVAEAVVWRAEALAGQLADRAFQHKTTIFFTPFEQAGAMNEPGQCWLCGEDLPTEEPGQHYRCKACAMAARLVLWRSIHIDFASADERAAAARASLTPATAASQLL